MSDALKSFIQSQGYSVRKLAKAAGLSSGTLSHYVTGRTRHESLLIYKRLADAMNISLDELADMLTCNSGISPETVSALDVQVITNSCPDDLPDCSHVDTLPSDPTNTRLYLLGHGNHETRAA